MYIFMRIIFSSNSFTHLFIFSVLFFQYEVAVIPKILNFNVSLTFVITNLAPRVKYTFFVWGQNIKKLLFQMIAICYKLQIKTHFSKKISKIPAIISNIIELITFTKECFSKEKFWYWFHKYQLLSKNWHISLTKNSH